MKNLKKVLSLVLALAMAFSLMSIAFAADKATDFTDYDEIDYQEAVNVLTSIGVINGVDDGDTFNPTGTLTREQGAKIVTYMLLGQDAADQLTTAKAPFTDVPASRWSAGAIAYCAERGILAGTGDGSFKPEGTLTGYAFAKMLLIALEYDPTAQGYTGSGWALNVAGDAVDADIAISGLIMSNDLTREQAAKMAYNTLVADIVTYPYANLGTTITTSDGTTVVAGAARPESKTYGTNNTNVTPSQNYNSVGSSDPDYYTQQFVEKYYPKLKLNSYTDAFGRPGSQWENKATNEKLPAVLDTPVQTYTAKTKAAQVASDLSAYTIDGVNITNTTPTDTGSIGYYRNGVYQKGDDALSISLTSTSPAADVADLTRDGKLVEFYANSANEITDIITIGYTVGEVTSVSTTSTQTSYVINGVTYRDFVDENASDTIKIYDGATLAVGDIVTFVKIGDKAHVWATTQVTGTQTSKNGSNNQITVAGTVYPVGVGVYTNSVDTLVSMNDFDNSTIEGIYYIDQYGYVVKTTAVGTSNYAYVIEVYTKIDTGIDGSTPTVQARVLLSDGTVAVRDVVVSKKNGNWVIANAGTTNSTDINLGSNPSAATVSSSAGQLVGRAFTYNLTDSTISLKSVNALQSTNATNTVFGVKSDSTTSYITKNKNSYTANGNTILVNNNTKFVVYSSEPKTAVIYTGSANLPSAIDTANLTGYFVTKTNDNKDSTLTNVATASVVFINNTSNGGKALTADVNKNYAYVDASKAYTTLEGNTTNYVYPATLADGSSIELTSTEDIGSATKGIYTYDDSKKLGDQLAYAVESTATTGITQDNGRIIYDEQVTVSGSLVALNTVNGINYYSITSDTKVVYIDEDLVEVDGNGGYFVFETDSNGKSTENLAAIFITTHKK